MDSISDVQMKFSQLLLPDDPQQRHLENLILTPKQFCSEVILQPYRLKTFTLNVSKLYPPLTFFFKGASPACNLRVYFSDRQKIKKPTSKRHTLMLDKGQTFFQHPKILP